MGHRPSSIRPRPSAIAGIAAILLAAPSAIALAQDAAVPEPAAIAAATAADGPVFSVAEFNLSYFRPAAGQPPLDALLDAPVTLGRSETGYTAPRDGLPLITRTVRQLNGFGQEPYHASGIQAVLVAVRDALLDRDIFGVYVAQSPQEITPAFADLRGSNANLSVIITTASLRSVRTRAAGERVAEGGEIEPIGAVDHPVHARIRENSPVQPSETPATISDLAINDYVYFLSRHPGRRVDLAVAPSVTPGEATLDYVITENKPLLLFAQASNTGTASTDYWRQRFGLLHTQLTDSDDVLSLEYSTANFDDVHGFTASYERPLPGNDRIRGRLYGSWSRYDAEDIGIFAQDFTGENVTIGLEAAWNVWQRREAFIDLVGGIRWDDFSVDRTIFGSTFSNSAGFLTPYIGARYERTSDWFSTRASATLEWQSDVLSNDDADLAGLGRTSPDSDWLVLRGGFSQSVYLEPLFNRVAFDDPSTPESSTLAHELQFRATAQYAFDNRLVPQAQSVVGGLTTVRGYPQSVVASDSSIVGTLEYRFHLPRALGVEEAPRELFGEPFRLAPQYVYGTPDWDLVLKGFLDVGITDVSDALSFEGGETLIGAGVGVDFQYRRNLNVRLDWGFVLEELEDRGANSGANRLHLVATILF